MTQGDLFEPASAPLLPSPGKPLERHAVENVMQYVAENSLCVHCHKKLGSKFEKLYQTPFGPAFIHQKDECNRGYNGE